MDMSSDDDLEPVPVSQPCVPIHKRTHEELEQEEQEEDHPGSGGFFVEEEDVKSPPNAHQIFAPTLSPAPPLHHGSWTDSGNDSAHHKKAISERQQERFVTYLEEHLMQIQRKFVQRITPPKGYNNLAELLVDLNRIIDIIWYSITSSEPASKDSSHNNVVQKPQETKAIKMYGQVQYLLSISDSLIDYIEGYAGDFKEPEATIRTFQKLDKIFDFLLDQPSNRAEFSNTERVRLESIAERSRVAVLNVFEGVEGYNLEVSNIYELVLDKLT